jgi:BlaI family transcriptional regulator, penicillinase repressor
MSPTKKLSELQMAVMRVLWDRGEATVAEVHEALEEERELAMTTVATILSRLEKQGVLAHRSQGRLFIYRPAVPEQEVRRSMLADLTERLFSGDVAALVSQLLSAREVSPDELARVKALIEEKEHEARPKDEEHRHGN